MGTRQRSGPPPSSPPRNDPDNSTIFRKISGVTLFHYLETPMSQRWFYPCIYKLVLPMYLQAGNTQVTYQFGGDLTHSQFGGVLPQHLVSVTQFVSPNILYTALPTPM